MSSYGSLYFPYSLLMLNLFLLFYKHGVVDPIMIYKPFYWKDFFPILGVLRNNFTGRIDFLGTLTYCLLPKGVSCGTVHN